jgi:hypothetical protein
METRTSNCTRGSNPRGIRARHSLWIRARPPFQRFLGLAHYSIKSELSRLYGDRMGRLWCHHRRGCHLHGSIDEAVSGALRCLCENHYFVGMGKSFILPPLDEAYAHDVLSALIARGVRSLLRQKTDLKEPDRPTSERRASLTKRPNHRAACVCPQRGCFRRKRKTTRKSRIRSRKGEPQAGCPFP